MDYFNTTDLASDRFEGKDEIEEDDDRMIISLLIDQVEFANVILLNKVDLCSQDQVANVKSTISKLNKKATIIETHKSVVDLNLVINTNKFDFDSMEMDLKGLNKEEEEKPKGLLEVITSFVYKRQKPFNPNRLYKVLKEAFMMEIVLPDEGGDDEEGEEEQEEEHHHHHHDEEVDPEYEARLAAAKEKYKQNRDLALESKKTTVFKDIVRSKGFLWLSNRPELFFEW